MPSRSERPQADVERARQWAQRLVTRYDLRYPADIDVEAIAMAEGVLVVEGPLVGAEARLVRGRRRGLVRVRGDIPEVGRRRLSIAHELGHWMMHRDTTQLPLLLCEVQERQLALADGQGDGYRDSPLEIEATVFASELLLPAALFEPLCEALPAPSLHDVKALAARFRTTLTATAVRLVQTLPQCFVAFSTPRSVTWWKRCETRRTPVFLWLQKQQPVDRASMAWCCHQLGLDDTERREVPLEAWFGHLKFKRPMRVHEQAMRLGTYDTVMSLLTVEKAD